MIFPLPFPEGSQQARRDAYWNMVPIAIPLITICSVFVYKHVYGKKKISPK